MREYITYQDKISELYLDLSHPHNKKINFVFVEGDTDVKLFRKLFDMNKCKVERIPGGNVKVEKCVTDLKSKHSLILGIRDADFLHIADETYLKPNMFLTDYHDVEMTMLSQQKILNAMLFEYTELPKTEHIAFRDKIMQAIEKTSYLKWLNDREHLELEFATSLQELFCTADLSFDFATYLDRVLAKSSNTQLKDVDVIIKKINKLMLQQPDLLQLTNGHDLVRTLAKYFREINKKRTPTEDTLASGMRLSYDFNCFEDSQLYDDLQKWAKSHSTILFDTI